MSSLTTRCTSCCRYINSLGTRYRSTVFQLRLHVPFQIQESIPRKPQTDSELIPQPLDDFTADGKTYKSSRKLQGRNALITGADNGIGRSVALLFEGAKLNLHCLEKEHEELKAVVRAIQKKGINGINIHLVILDLRNEMNCKRLIEEHLKKFGALHTLVLNHGTQEADTDPSTFPIAQWPYTFDTIVHSLFYICKCAVPQMQPGSITFNASINMVVEHTELLDYTATQGAIVAFMRALSNQVVGEKGIRCNAIAPATMTKESVKAFGTSVFMGRAGQPVEVATSFVGQVIHVNGGVVII